MQNNTALNPIIIIPARMASTRLPRKPLADIGGVPMIVHVMNRARTANIGPVIIACSEVQVFDVVKSYGGTAVMTDPDLPSGTDRVRVAADIIDPDGAHNVVINLQGDLPIFDPSILTRALDILVEQPQCDLSTLAVPTTDPREMADPNVVKAVIAMRDEGNQGRALYFTRASAPYGASISTSDAPLWHHVGLYAYRREALNKFCALPVSPLEAREKLEQLRALEAGMRIDVGIIDSAPEGVDTPEDLERARRLIGS